MDVSKEGERLMESIAFGTSYHNGCGLCLYKLYFSSMKGAMTLRRRILHSRVHVRYNIFMMTADE